MKRILKWIESLYKDIRYHTPQERLNDKEIERIKVNGLVHFTEHKNKSSIEKDGIVGGLKKPMSRKEKGFTWFYIYDIEEFQEKRDIVLSKGERKKYNAFVIIKGLDDEQISKLRIRRKIDNAVIYPGTLKTDNITVNEL